jgi:hypothetical protein
MVGFVVLVGVGIVTVLRPELEDEPSADSATKIETVCVGNSTFASHLTNLQYYRELGSS